MTRQINHAFIQGLLTIQDQEFFKGLHKRKLCKQYRKITHLASNGCQFHRAWAVVLDAVENFRSRPESEIRS